MTTSTGSNAFPITCHFRVTTVSESTINPLHQCFPRPTLLRKNLPHAPERAQEFSLVVSSSSESVVSLRLLRVNSEEREVNDRCRVDGMLSRRYNWSAYVAHSVAAAWCTASPVSPLIRPSELLLNPDV